MAPDGTRGKAAQALQAAAPVKNKEKERGVSVVREQFRSMEECKKVTATCGSS